MPGLTLLTLAIVALPQSPAPDWGECSIGDDARKLGRFTEDAAGHFLADTLARAFAPILGFAAGERYFPTIPFFTAFDGANNRGDDRLDLRDPDEITPLAPLEGFPSWSILDSVYQRKHDLAHDDHGRREFGLNRVVVFYRLCTLEPHENQNLIRYLKSDEQAWERFFKDDTPLETILGDRPEFDVIQYFLYYVRDVGLQGHPQDIELVSVFLPRERDKHSKFRIVVGSGHSTRTPNNVLVLSSQHLGVASIAKAFERDTSHPDNIHVLVELGGHSSSPDLPPYGQYTPGIDVNWHVYDVWGTRDIQAVAGTGYLGSYRPAMTFERDFNAVTVFPPDYETTQMEQVQKDLKQGPAEERPATTTAPKPPHQYRLLPVRLLVALDQALAYPTPSRDLVTERVDEIQRALRRSKGRGSTPTSPSGAADAGSWISDYFSQLNDVEKDAAIAAMKRWKEAVIVDDTLLQRRVLNLTLPGAPVSVEPLWIGPRTMVDGKKHRIWEHDSFKDDPTRVFKANLFRPATATLGGWWGMIKRLSLGFRGIASEANEVYTGFVIPAFRSRGFPVRTPGFLEAQLGLYWGRGGKSPALSLVHENHRNAMISWFAGASWVPRRPEATRIADAGEFGLSVGLSLLPYIKDSPVLNAVRLRSGIRFDPFQGKDVLGRVRWEFHLAIRQ